MALFASANFLDQTGANVSGFTDGFGQTGDFPMADQSYQGLVNVQWHGFTLNGYANNHDSKTLPFVLVTLPKEDWSIQRRFIDLGYKHDFNDKRNLALNGLYHDYDVPGLALFPGGTTLQLNTMNVLYEGTLQGQVTEKLRVTLGGIYDNQSRNVAVKPAISFDNWDINNYSVYAQLEYQITDWLRAVGGGQWNKRETGPDDLSPRFDLIANWADHWNAKISYGEAFRSPVADELINSVLLVSKRSNGDVL